MGIFSWIILGLLAGIVAKMLMPGKDPGGCLSTTVLGIIGGLLGGFIGTQAGWGTVDRFDFRSLMLAVVGAALVLFLRRMISGKKD